MFASETNMSYRLRRFFELTVPIVVSMFCVVLTMLPYGLWAGVVMAPSFALMAIYYWTLYRPDILPPFAVFFIGLYQDLLSGGPLGMWPVIYLSVYGLIVSQRLFFIGKAFLAIWFGFGAIVLLSCILTWAIGSLYFAAVLSPGVILLQGVLTFALYPLFGRLFAGIQRLLLSAA